MVGHLTPLYGCGEYVPGTVINVTPKPPPPPPPITITIHGSTGKSPPLIPGPDYEPIDPRTPFPGGPGNTPPNSGAPGGPATPNPGFGGPTTPGPTAPPGGGGFGGPTTPGPTAPPGGGGFGGPTTPGPTLPPGGGGGGRGRSGPTTPGPLLPPGGGGGGRNGNEPDDPFRFERDPVTGVIDPFRLEDVGSGGGGGGDTLTFTQTQTFRLEDASPGTGGGPTTSVQGALFTLEDANSPPQSAASNSGNSQQFPNPKSSTNLNLSNNSEQSRFSSSFRDNNNTLYDPIYNIMDHKNSPTVFVSNTLSRNIFSNRVTLEVDYLLKNMQKRANWEERYITGLTDTKILVSLNPLLQEAFSVILDINGRPVGINNFIETIKKKLLSGTIDTFDPAYYIFLANSVRGRSSLILNPTANEQSKRNAVLALMSRNSYSAVSNTYGNLSQQIEIARMRFLLTDLEATFDVQVLNGTEYQLQLEDAGVEVEYAQQLGVQESSNSVSSDYVPPGEGDGYYYKIETESGSLLPLVLDTSLNDVRYVTADVRKLALEILNKNSSYTLESYLPYNDSEMGANYVVPYTASATYYKLDLRTTQATPTDDSFIEVTEATYVKLTDQQIIDEHTKTFGAKAIQMNVQYDDPFLQYSGRSGKIKLSMNDVTFRQFLPKRTPTGNSIVPRNLPDALIITPVNNAADNPLQAYSEITTFNTTQVGRSLACQISFNLFPEETKSRVLKTASTWVTEGISKYGLIGIDDTENFYYLFNPNDYRDNILTNPNKSAQGHFLYDIIERLRTKYSFTNLYWWDIYRRLTLKEFSSLLTNFPDEITNKIRQGFFGFPIKDVLYRQGQQLNNLVEINSSIDDPIFLDGRNRYNVSSR